MWRKAELDQWIHYGLVNNIIPVEERAHLPVPWTFTEWYWLQGLSFEGIDGSTMPGFIPRSAIPFEEEDDEIVQFFETIDDAEDEFFEAVQF